MCAPLQAIFGMPTTRRSAEETPAATAPTGAQAATTTQSLLVASRSWRGVGAAPPRGRIREEYTCYMNAALLVLDAVPAARQLLLRCPIDHNAGLAADVAEALCEALRTGDAAALTELLPAIGDGYSKFQQDDVLDFLFDAIAAATPAIVPLNTGDASPFEALLQGACNESICCAVCDTPSSQRTVTFEKVELWPEEHASVEAAVRAHFHGSIDIDTSGSTWRCPCGSSQRYRERSLLLSPEALIVDVMRGRQGDAKNPDHVSFRRRLTVGRVRYDLSLVLEHVGRSSASGHWKGYQRNVSSSQGAGDEFMRVDDLRCDPASWSAVSRQQASVLVYVRAPDPPPPPPQPARTTRSGAQPASNRFGPLGPAADSDADSDDEEPSPPPPPAPPKRKQQPPPKKKKKRRRKTPTSKKRRRRASDASDGPPPKPPSGQKRQSPRRDGEARSTRSRRGAADDDDEPFAEDEDEKSGVGDPDDDRSYSGDGDPTGDSSSDFDSDDDDDVARSAYVTSCLKEGKGAYLDGERLLGDAAAWRKFRRHPSSLKGPFSAVFGKKWRPGDKLPKLFKTLWRAHGHPWKKDPASYGYLVECAKIFFDANVRIPLPGEGYTLRPYACWLYHWGATLRPRRKTKVQNAARALYMLLRKSSRAAKARALLRPPARACEMCVRQARELRRHCGLPEFTHNKITVWADEDRPPRNDNDADQILHRDHLDLSRLFRGWYCVLHNSKVSHQADEFCNDIYMALVRREHTNAGTFIDPPPPSNDDVPPPPRARARRRAAAEEAVEDAPQPPPKKPKRRSPRNFTEDMKDW